MQFWTFLLNILDERRRRLDQPQGSLDARGKLDAWLSTFSLRPESFHVVRIRLFHQAGVLARRQKIDAARAVDLVIDRYFTATAHPERTMAILARMHEERLVYKNRGTKKGNGLWEDARALAALIRTLDSHVTDETRLYAVIARMARDQGTARLNAASADDLFDPETIEGLFGLWSRFHYKDADFLQCWKVACMARRSGIPNRRVYTYVDQYGLPMVTPLHHLLEEQRMDPVVIDAIIANDHIFRDMPTSALLECVRHWDEGGRQPNGLVPAAITARRAHEHGLAIIH